MILFVQAPDESLCPVCHVWAYSEFTVPLHSSRSFFVITTPHCAAARDTLQQRFASVLRDVGTDAQPVSAHALALARGLSDNAVMEVADCSSAQTFFSNDLNLLLAGVLPSSYLCPALVQEALLN